MRRCAILAFLLGLPFALFSNIGGVFLFFLAIAALFGIGYVLLLVLHVLLLTFFFSKYSLGQFIRVLMVAGLGVSLVVELEDGWKILPGLGLIALFAIVLIYVGSYDPVRGNRVIPRAAREMLFNPPDAPKPSTDRVREKRRGVEMGSFLRFIAVVLILPVVAVSVLALSAYGAEKSPESRDGVRQTQNR